VINDFPGTENEAEAVFDLARLFYAQEDYKKARAYFNVIITKFPSMVYVEESYYLLMLCAKAGKDAAVFEKAYDEYNAKGFFTFKNRVNLAYAGYLYESGKYAKALLAYKELIEKTQGKDRNIYMPLVYSNAAKAAGKAGDLQAAEMLESDLKFKYPDSPEAKGEAAKATPGTEGVVTRIKPEKTVVAAPEAPKAFYTVQIGAYSNKRFCDLTAAKLKEKKYEVFVKQDGKFFRLSVGRFATKQEADAFAPGFAKKEKLKSWLVKQGWE
jgi:tetratricopeptide (TPR) repeat protein